MSTIRRSSHVKPAIPTRLTSSATAQTGAGVAVLDDRIGAHQDRDAQGQAQHDPPHVALLPPQCDQLGAGHLWLDVGREFTRQDGS
jgi:hypothetical protein